MAITTRDAESVSSLQTEVSGAAGLTTFPAAAAAANGVSLAEVIRYIQENGTDLILSQLSGAAGIASWPAGAAPGNAVSLAEGLRFISDALCGTVGLAAFPAAAAAANDVSLAEVLRYVQENGTDAILAQLSGAAGIASFPTAAAAANGISLAEVIRYIQETQLGGADATTTDMINGKLGTDTELADRSLFDVLASAGPAAFPVSAAPANDVSLAAVIRQIYDQTGIGSVFCVQKTINQNTIVAAGVDLTGVSAGGALLLEDVIIQEATAVDSTGHAAVVEMYSNNVLGNRSFATFAQAKLPANGGCDFKNATTAAKLVLETGKKISVKATTEDVTSSADITFTLVFRRLAAVATIAAA